MLNDIPFDPEAPVLVIGAAALDMIGRLQAAPQSGTSNPSLIRSSFGGVARNVAENLARLGQPVNLLGAVGADQVGDQLIEQLNAAGVDTQAVLRSAEYPTGAYMAAYDERGALQLALDDMRIISLITPQVIQAHEALFEQAGMLFLDANLAPETLQSALRLAHRFNLRVCADPASSGLAPRLRPHLSSLYLVTPNTREAGVLCERTLDKEQQGQALEAARCLVGDGIEIAIITLSQFGVVYATAETSGHIPAIRTAILDQTGAGDALTAAMIFALMNGIPLDDAVRLGVSAASLTLQYPGTVRPDLTLELLYDGLSA